MNKDKILRVPEVSKIVGCSSASLRRMEKNGVFPKRRRIGIRSVGWLESEVAEWLAQRSHAVTTVSPDVVGDAHHAFTDETI